MYTSINNVKYVDANLDAPDNAISDNESIHCKPVVNIMRILQNLIIFSMMLRLYKKTPIKYWS